MSSPLFSELTEDNFDVQSLIDNVINYDMKQQILEKQKKAKKYDALGDIIKQVNELLLENKQLKEELSKTVGDYINLKNEHDNLKQKLEQIKEWNDSKNRNFFSLKEILGKEK